MLKLQRKTEQSLISLETDRTLTASKKQQARLDILQDILKHRLHPSLSDLFIQRLQACIGKVIRAKGKAREAMQSMKTKYVFAKHTLPHFFDPVTGILRRKDEFNNYRKIDEMREKQLVQEIMRQVSSSFKPFNFQHLSSCCNIESCKTRF